MDTPIVKTEVFTVKSANKNTYGDLEVITTGGAKHKIGKKREGLFNIFQEGAEVEVGYSVYMNKEYIAAATQTGTHKIIPKEPPAVTEVKKGGAVIEKVITKDSKNRAFALSYSKDLAVGGKIETKEIITMAKRFEKYLEEGE